MNLGDYVIVRTENAGVFAGTLEDSDTTSVRLSNARRIWYWEGAASLSELAVEGTILPNECKFPVEVEEVFLTGVIEVIKVTDRARTSIKSVPIWTAKNIGNE